MTEEEYRQQVNQRWKETMALLGFDDPGPAPDEMAQPEPPQAPPLPRKEPEESQFAEPRRIVTQTVEFAEKETAIQRAEIPKGVEEFRPTAVGASKASSELDSGEDRSGRRRRGRRGRRGSQSEHEAIAGTGENPAGASEAEAQARPIEEKEEGRKRGRGRTRERPPRIREQNRAEKDESVTTEAAFKADFDDDESTDLTDWDIPSWQELISSLYRPER